MMMFYTGVSSGLRGVSLNISTQTVTFNNSQLGIPVYPRISASWLLGPGPDAQLALQISVFNPPQIFSGVECSRNSFPNSPRLPCNLRPRTPNLCQRYGRPSC